MQKRKNGEKKNYLYHRNVSHNHRITAHEKIRQKKKKSSDGADDENYFNRIMGCIEQLTNPTSKSGDLVHLQFSEAQSYVRSDYCKWSLNSPPNASTFGDK
ncbi:hypothetical protein CDAR_441831 [Caerostris darwini]|uniref:Uncharacterized protein n=1 Tax=Caerostris darwini TaxID=1538125 RepID=A0AAV4VZB6_9ARAC|nr:hypothetical protein CDAR_441831 [Caerostris darwini]